jgi:hypothetical protein
MKQRVFDILAAVQDRKNAGMMCWIIFVLALAVRTGVLYMESAGRNFHLELSEAIRVALSLAHDGNYGNAWDTGTPTAHVSPLYPILLSVLLRIFGDHAAGEIAKEAFSTLLTSAQYALLPLVALACQLPLIVGFAAGLMAALLPISFYVQTGANEYALSAFLIVLVSIAILKAWRDRDFSRRRASIIGVLTALNLLTTPQFALILGLALILPYVFLRATRRAGYGAFAMIQVVIVAAALAPWVIRNYAVLGSPIWGRSNFGLELHVSNNEMATPLWDKGVLGVLHPFANPAEAGHAAAIGEVAYNKEKLAQAKQWILENPGRFAKLTSRRFVYFWLTPKSSRAQYLALVLIVGLGLIGMGFLARERNFVFYYFLMLWCLYPAPLYVFQQSDRLRFPIEWSIFLMAAFALYHLGIKWFHPHVPGEATASTSGRLEDTVGERVGQPGSL